MAALSLYSKRLMKNPPGSPFKKGGWGNIGDAMRKQAGTKGFTLLEVLVALSILAIAVTLVLQLFSSNLRLVSLSGNMTQAVARAECRIREILSGEPLIPKAWSETTDDGYQIDVSIAETLQERTDNLPIKLMAIGLTIHWVEGRKDKNFSLKTVKMVDKLAQR